MTPRILHVVTGLGIGGAEATLVTLTRELALRGFEQRVVALTGGPNEAALRANGIALDVLDARDALLFLTLLRLAGIARAFRPDVVQGWMYHGDLAALATKPFLSRGSRVFWGIRASDMDFDRYGRLLRLCARLSGFPDVVVANSRSGMAAHRKLGYRPRRIEVIPNGIDTVRFRPDSEARARRRAEWGLTADAVVAAHVARVDLMKDHATLLAAIRLAPRVTFLLAGDGTESLTLPANARALGRVPDPEALYRAADIVVSSSAFGEGFPNVIAEGMACGCVAVATRSGDSADIIGDTGEVVSPRDAPALAAAIQREAERSASERLARSAAARDRIILNFASERMTAAFAELYRLPASGPG